MEHKAIKLWILRSNSASPDVRVTKYLRLLKGLRFQCTFIGWNRELRSEKDHHFVKQLYCDIVLMSLKSSYGSGLRNAWKLALFQLWLVWQLIKHRESPDFVHACDFDTAFAALIACKIRILLRRKSFKLIYDIFDFYTASFPVPEAIKSIVLKLDRLTIKSSQAVILPTDSRINQINFTETENGGRVYVIPNASDLQASGTQKTYDRIVLGYCGVLVPARYLQELMEIVTENPRIFMNIVGFGPLENVVMEFAAKHSNIVYHGRMEHQHAMDIMAQSTVLPALYEPILENHRYASPNKLYEALQLGIPLLVFQNSGVDDLVAKWGVGVVCNPDKTSVLSGIIKASEMHVPSLIKQTKDIYEAHYSEDIQRQTYLKILYA